MIDSVGAGHEDADRRYTGPGAGPIFDWPDHVATTSTYWKMEVGSELAEAADRDGDGHDEAPQEAAERRLGHSKDHRDYLPQVVSTMAVTRDGIPVRSRTFPGNEQDQKIIRTVKDDLSDSNLRRGRRGAARQGRYHEVTGNLRVKGVWVPAKNAGERAERFTCTTRAGRAGPAGPRAIARLEQLIHGSYAWTPGKRDELAGSLNDKPALRRLLRRTKTGLLRADRSTAARGACLDGKWLLASNDRALTAEDLAAAVGHRSRSNAPDLGTTRVCPGHS